MEKTKGEKVIQGAQVIVALYSAAVAIKGLGEMAVQVQKFASQKLQAL